MQRRLQSEELVQGAVRNLGSARVIDVEVCTTITSTSAQQKQTSADDTRQHNRNREELARQLAASSCTLSTHPTHSIVRLPVSLMLDSVESNRVDQPKNRPTTHASASMDKGTVRRQAHAKPTAFSSRRSRASAGDPGAANSGQRFTVLICPLAVNATTGKKAKYGCSFTFGSSNAPPARARTHASTQKS